MTFSAENKEDVDRASASPRWGRHRSGVDAGHTGNFTKYFGYSVSCVSFCAGIVFLTGLFIRTTIPTQLRVMFGVVFVLMGVYRFFATRYKMQALNRGDI